MKNESPLRPKKPRRPFTSPRPCKPKEAEVSQAELPPGWGATVEGFLRNGKLITKPQVLKEALRMLKGEVVEEGERVHPAAEALRRFIAEGGAAANDEDLHEFARMIGRCASASIQATQKYPRQYFRDLAAAIRKVRREDPDLLKPDPVEVGFWVHSYEEFAMGKGKPGRKPPAADMAIEWLSHKFKKRLGRPCDNVTAALLHMMNPEREYDAR